MTLIAHPFEKIELTESLLDELCNHGGQLSTRALEVLRLKEHPTRGWRKRLTGAVVEVNRWHLDDLLADVKRQRESADPLGPILEKFWSHFGTRHVQHTNLGRKATIEILIEFDGVSLPPSPGHSWKGLRKQFNLTKRTGGSLCRASCFACQMGATVRHHIVKLASGGDNRPENIIRLCDECHASIHPWLQPGPVEHESPARTRQNQLEATIELCQRLAKENEELKARLNG